MGASTDLRPVLRVALFPWSGDCWIRESSCRSHRRSWLGATPLALARALRVGLVPELLERILLTRDASLIFSRRENFFLRGMICKNNENQ